MIPFSTFAISPCFLSVPDLPTRHAHLACPNENTVTLSRYGAFHALCSAMLALFLRSLLKPVKEISLLEKA